MARLTRLHVVIIFLVAYLIVGVGLYWFMIKPKNEELTKAKADLQARQAVADTLNQSQQDLDAALMAKAKVENKHDYYVKKYMPSNIRDLSPINQRRYLKAYWDETVNGTGRVLDRFARSLPVTMQEGYRFQIPAAPLDPHVLPTDAIGTPIRWQFTNVTCYGSYPNILKYLRSWVNCPRLVRIDKLQLEGESPYVTCVMDLTVFVFLRKPNPGETEVIVEPYLADGGGGGGSFGGSGLPGGTMTPSSTGAPRGPMGTSSGVMR